MKTGDIIALIILLICIVWGLFIILSTICKKKIRIEEQTLGNGRIQYVIKENWYFKLPFLWDTVWGWDSFYVFECIFQTKEEALEWLEHEKQLKEKIKQQIDDDKIINKRIVYEGKEK